VCSLYPFVNKYGKYPVEHPKIHVGPEVCALLDIETIEGLVKCTVLPPQDLYHPVLPYRCNGAVHALRSSVKLNFFKNIGYLII
jgi:hypothetical protein